MAVRVDALMVHQAGEGKRTRPDAVQQQDRVRIGLAPPQLFLLPEKPFGLGPTLPHLFIGDSGEASSWLRQLLRSFIFQILW